MGRRLGNRQLLRRQLADASWRRLGRWAGCRCPGSGQYLRTGQRDRLGGRRWAERQTTLKDLVEELALAVPTAGELAEREQRTREVLAEFFGVQVTEADLAASARLREMIARQASAA